jgi:hypothetical protein
MRNRVIHLRNEFLPHFWLDDGGYQRAGPFSLIAELSWAIQDPQDRSTERWLLVLSGHFPTKSSWKLFSFYFEEGL